MTLALKLLAVATPIVGGGIVIPIYLNSQTSSAFSRSTAKATCKVSEIPTSSADVTKVLQHKDLGNDKYSYLYCSDTSFEGEKVSMFDGAWTSLFPKKAFNEIFPSAGSNNFSINISVIKDLQSGNNTEIIFSNPDTHKSIKGRRGSYSQADSGKKVVLVTISEGEYSGESIDIFTDKI